MLMTQATQDASALALTTSSRAPQGRLIIEIYKEVLFKLGATSELEFLSTYVREAGRIRAIALRLASAILSPVVRIRPNQFD